MNTFNPPSPQYQPQQYTSPFIGKTTDLKPQLVLEAQKLLTSLGYDTGPITGEYNEQTMAAVMRFEFDHNKTADGRLDGPLLNDIRYSLARSKIKEVKPKQKPKQKKQQPSNIFAKGSPTQLVIKLQGEPDSIIPHHTYEMWYYGYSSVKISLQTHKVIDWNNTDGKLKVE